MRAHPWLRVAPDRQRMWCTRLILATCVVMAALWGVGQGLVIPRETGEALGIEGRNDVVAFELRAQEVLENWDAADAYEQRHWTRRSLAQISLWLDMVFLLLYANAIALSCLLRASAWRSRWGIRLAVLLAWGMWIAGALDAIENGALLCVLADAGAPWPAVARAAALPKFALVLAGILYVLFSWPLGLARRLAGSLRVPAKPS